MPIRRFFSFGRDSSSLLAHLLVPPLCLATLLYGPPLEAIETAIEARQRLEAVASAPEPSPSSGSSSSRSVEEKPASVEIRYAQKHDPPPSLPRGVVDSDAKAGTTGNLLSIPHNPGSTDPADMLDPIDGDYERALWWDACADTPGWRACRPPRRSSSAPAGTSSASRPARHATCEPPSPRSKGNTSASTPTIRRIRPTRGRSTT